MMTNTEISFTDLGLPGELLEGVKKAGFSHCTPIQAQTLPLALAGKDVAGQAQTGTGKTAAFLLATFNHLLHKPDRRPDKRAGPRALMLAPTRELAVQINADALMLACATKFRIAVVYGGADYEKQRQTLQKGVDILIGTPGRLIDYFKQKIFRLDYVQVLVLDEADRMFDLGFIRDIRYLLRRLPPPGQRLNLLFSATLSYRVIELSYEHMNDPEVIRIEPDKMTVDGVTQVVYFPSNEEKIPLLIALLRSMQATRTMVFANTKREVEYLARVLRHNGLGARGISGDVPQTKRLDMLRAFQSGELPVLVATDVASRGLHVPDVRHVVNYALPQDPEDYVHRIGRTARAGASGDAVSFACESYAVTLPEIEAYLGHPIPVGSINPEDLPPVELPPPAPRKRPPRGRPGGKRPGSRDGRSAKGRRPRR
jgi:ATP-dependent RNA helicase RhlB